MTDEDLQRIVERLIQKVEGRFFGKYPAFVVDNQDPQKRGRIRALCPAVLGATVVSGWAEPCVPYGGGHDFGNFSIPPITKDNDDNPTTGVWLEFQGGDPQFPIWVGTFWGAPNDTPEAPGDDDAPDIQVHVNRTFAGHSILAVDTSQEERLELRDASGQRLTFSGPMKADVKRDSNGKKGTETASVAYGDLVANKAAIELVDFAGNTLLMDADKEAPTIKITNTDRDGSVLQTIEMYGGKSEPKVVITDHNKNVVKLDKDGITIESPDNSDTILMNSDGIQQDAPEINLNSGTKGGARLDDQVKSTIVEDSTFWTWVTTLMTWLATHTHGTGVGPSTPPIVPYPASTPSACVGKIIESSKTVIVGD